MLALSKKIEQLKKDLDAGYYVCFGQKKIVTIFWKSDLGYAVAMPSSKEAGGYYSKSLGMYINTYSIKPTIDELVVGLDNIIGSPSLKKLVEAKVGGE